MLDRIGTSVGFVSNAVVRVLRSIGTFFQVWALLYVMWTPDMRYVSTWTWVSAHSMQGKISFIDASDLAEVAVRALTTDQLVNNTYELTGPEALSYSEVAEKFTNLLGRPIQYVDLPNEAWRGGMLSAGVPDWYADGLIGLYNFYGQGKGAPVIDTVTQLVNRRPTNLDSYLQANRALFTQRSKV